MNAQEVYQLMRQGEFYSVDEISGMSKMNETIASRHLNSLAKGGLIERKIIGGDIFYITKQKELPLAVG